MSGPIALHGGGEFEPGDEPVLTDLLRAAESRAGPGRAIRIALVPTAAAQWDPAESAEHGVAAFQRVAASIGLTVLAEPVMIVDEASAASDDLAGRIEGSDLVYLPGGDPGRIVTTFRGSRAMKALTSAHEAGAILAGASAGAMALAAWTWAPNGGVDGLGFIPRFLVVPHADQTRWTASVTRFTNHAPRGLGILGLAERTAAIADDADSDPITWRVVGAGHVRWTDTNGAELAVARDGDRIETRVASLDRSV